MIQKYKLVLLKKLDKVLLKLDKFKNNRKFIQENIKKLEKKYSKTNDVLLLKSFQDDYEKCMSMINNIFKSNVIQVEIPKLDLDNFSKSDIRKLKEEIDELFYLQYIQDLPEIVKEKRYVYEITPDMQEYMKKFAFTADTPASTASTDIALLF